MRLCLGLLLCVIMAFSSCDAAEEPEITQETLLFSRDIAPILNRAVCRACHYGTAHDGFSDPLPLYPYGFSLMADSAYSHLVNRPSVQVPAILRVKPGDPENSYLIMKLRPEHSRRLGNQMILDDAKVDSVVRWIAQGAHR